MRLLRDGALAPMGGLDGPMGGAGIVEADETFIGREPGAPKKRAYHHRRRCCPCLTARPVRSAPSWWTILARDDPPDH